MAKSARKFVVVAVVGTTKFRMSAKRHDTRKDANRTTKWHAQRHPGLVLRVVAV